MRTQSDIERDVRAELQWQPGLRDITAVVKDGIVQLNGVLHYHRDKLDAERAVRRIVDEATDHALAREALLAIRARLPEVRGSLRIVVRNSWVYLEGETKWPHERRAAEDAVRCLNGVKGITDHMRTISSACLEERERVARATPASPMSITTSSGEMIATTMNSGRYGSGIGTAPSKVSSRVRIRSLGLIFSNNRCPA